MSSEVIARVISFLRKGAELSLQDQLRAAESYNLGFEAASALGADSLVALDMQLKQGNILGMYVNLQATADSPRALSAHRARRVALHSTVVAALERRRVAGTLLEGACRPEDEAYYDLGNRDAAGYLPTPAKLFQLATCCFCKLAQPCRWCFNVQTCTPPSVPLCSSGRSHSTSRALQT